LAAGCAQVAKLVDAAGL